MGIGQTSLGKIWLLKAIKMGTIYIDDVIFGMNEVKNSPADGGKHRSVDHGHIFWSVRDDLALDWMVWHMADHMESSPSMVGSGDHRAGGDHGVLMVGVAKLVRYAGGANTKNEETIANEWRSSRWHQLGASDKHQWLMFAFKANMHIMQASQKYAYYASISMNSNLVEGIWQCDKCSS